MPEIITKNSRSIKAEIKIIDDKITKQKNKIKMLKLEKIKLESERNKQVLEITKLNNIATKIEEINVIKEQIKKNKTEISMLKSDLIASKVVERNKVAWFTATISDLKTEIEKEVIPELWRIDEEIRKIEIVEVNNLVKEFDEANININDDNLNKGLKISRLNLKKAKLVVKLEEKTHKTKKLFSKIAKNKVEIANKNLQIKTILQEFYVSKKMAEKEIENAILKVKIKNKKHESCNFNLNISAKILTIANIDEKIARLNVRINKKEISINNYLEKIKQKKQDLGSQSIKTLISIFLKSPFIWLNERFQRYKYELKLNQYQSQLQKLEKVIIKLETEKPRAYFWNKFLFIISNGNYDSDSKERIKAEKKAKLYEIKQKICALTRTKEVNTESQIEVATGFSWEETSSHLDEGRYFNENQYQDKMLNTAFNGN